MDLPPAGAPPLLTDPVQGAQGGEDQAGQLGHQGGGPDPPVPEEGGEDQQAGGGQILQRGWFKKHPLSPA